MARIETWFDQDLQKAVKVQYIDGNVFSQDNNGNVVGVNVFNNGVPASLNGSVSGTVIPDMKCELCGADMVLRTGRFGNFYACSQYPACKFTKQKTKEIGVDCPKCGKPLITRHGRRRTFYGCSNYPNCDFSSWDLPTNEQCPECGGMLFVKKNKNLLVCAKDGCGYSRKAPEVVELTIEDTEEI
jgi:ssDNA-binding Zn-finger/Zn-ribbon topoisomerase 1